MTRQTLPSFFTDESSKNPFVSSLQKEIDHVFDRFRGQPAASDLFAKAQSQIMPALDIAETDDAVEITAEVPGVKKDDLDVSITNDLLILKGEKSSDHEEKEKDYHLVEHSYGSFRRQIPLGFTPADDAVSVNFADGVLKLTIKKPDEAVTKTRKIEIDKA